MKILDFSILRGDAANSQTLEWLDWAEEERERIKSTNNMSTDNSPVELSLAGLRFTMRKSNLFSALDTFHEIFHLNNHFLHDDFYPENNWIILDFGANEGFYSARLKQIAPECRIIAYEPNPYEFELLRGNMHNNYFSMEINQEAVYSHECQLEIEVIPQIGPIGGIALQIPQRKWLKQEFIRKLTVPAVSPDSIFRKYSLEKVDLLKIDVEGSEMKILDNFHYFDRVQRMIIEYHSTELRCQVIECMETNGFQLVLSDSLPDDYYGEFYFIRQAKV